jgi:hypothetical protein
VVGPRRAAQLRDRLTTDASEATTNDRPACRRSAVSDSGSRMGAEGRCQLRLEAVAVPGWKPLMCGNVVQQRLCRVARSVRMEGVRGSMANSPAWL